MNRKEGVKRGKDKKRKTKGRKLSIARVSLHRCIRVSLAMRPQCVSHTKCDYFQQLFPTQTSAGSVTKYDHDYPDFL